MLETIRNAFKTKEIRNKLLFVFWDAYHRPDRM